MYQLNQRSVWPKVIGIIALVCVTIFGTLKAVEMYHQRQQVWAARWVAQQHATASANYLFMGVIKTSDGVVYSRADLIDKLLQQSLTPSVKK